MSIATAKPSLKELARVPHYFIDHIDITEGYSVGKYEKEFDQKLTQYFNHNDIGIVVGGTGLYIKAILEGLDDFNDIDVEVKNNLQASYEQKGTEYLQELLQKLDPNYYAQVDQHNPRRLIRALEVCLNTGMPYSDFLAKKEKKILNCIPIMIGLELPRKEMYAHIDQRVVQMIDDGLIAEVTNLHHQRGLAALDTVGCTEIFDYLDGKHSKEEAIALIQRNSRRYAKRQLTWFKKYGEWQWFLPTQRDEVIAYIERNFVG